MGRNGTGFFVSQQKRGIERKKKSGRLKNGQKRWYVSDVRPRFNFGTRRGQGMEQGGPHDDLPNCTGRVGSVICYLCTCERTNLGLVAVTPSAACLALGGDRCAFFMQALLESEADDGVRNLLPHYVDGDLSALCIWPDQVRHWYHYRWTSPLHFIDTPDNACSFDYTRDCHDTHGKKNMCVAGAVRNFTSQLLHYKEGSADRRCKKTRALYYLGDCYIPMHVGFTSDEGGNAIPLRWYRHKSNLHHVWDREIILTALKELYNEDMNLFQEDIQANFTSGMWSDDVSSWEDCDDLLSCPSNTDDDDEEDDDDDDDDDFLICQFIPFVKTRFAAESINIACKWGYKDAEADKTLADDYFNTRFPIVARRIAQGGVRLAMFLNKVFGDHDEEIPRPT
ncbi:hypothetical protein ACLOJK_015231 [Asimina triloba]